MSNSTSVNDCTQSAILAKLRELIHTVAEHMGHGGVEVGNITLETPLLDLPIDSLGTFELIGSIEETFSIQIPEGKELEWETLGDVVVFVRDASVVDAPPTGA